MKTCKCCNEQKELEAFDKRAVAKDGRSGRCKVCRKTAYTAKRESILKRRKELRNEIKDTPEFKEKRRQKYAQNRDIVRGQQRAYREANREKVKAQKKRYYEKNKDRILAEQKADRAANPELYRERERVNRQNNLERERMTQREYCKSRRENDLQYRILGNLRTRIRLSIRNKSECTRDLLGCSLDKFIHHLEAQFAPDMTWANYGSYWSIDHIKPCCAFDLNDPEQQRACFNWTNCRPLSRIENSRKGGTTDRESRRKSDQTADSRVS